MAILKAKAVTQQRSVNIRIPMELHTELEAVRSDADAAGFSFAVTDIVTEALSKACKQARNELGAIAQQSAKQTAQQLAHPSCDTRENESAGSID